MLFSHTQDYDPYHTTSTKLEMGNIFDNFIFLLFTLYFGVFNSELYFHLNICSVYQKGYIA